MSKLQLLQDPVIITRLLLSPPQTHPRQTDRHTHTYAHTFCTILQQLNKRYFYQGYKCSIMCLFISELTGWVSFLHGRAWWSIKYLFSPLEGTPTQLVTTKKEWQAPAPAWIALAFARQSAWQSLCQRFTSLRSQWQLSNKTVAKPIILLIIMQLYLDLSAPDVCSRASKKSCIFHGNHSNDIFSTQTTVPSQI